MKTKISPAKGFRFYVSDAGDADQQTLVETGKDGGAVLENDCIQKLVACHGLELPADVEPGILAEAVNLLREMNAWLVAPDLSGDTLTHWETKSRGIVAKLTVR